MKTINSTLADAIAAGCDCVQFKYQGEQKVIKTDTCTFLAAVLSPPWVESERTIVLDCLEVNGESLSDYEYLQRYAFAKHFIENLNLKYGLVVNYPIRMAPELWSQDLPFVCGVVYRNSKAKEEDPLRVARKYKEMPGGLP